MESLFESVKYMNKTNDANVRRKVKYLNDAIKV